MLRLAALAPVFAVGIATGLLGCSGHGKQVIAPAGTPKWLRADATRAAAALGDKHPRLIQFFLARYDKIVIHGHFRCPTCSRPSNATPIQTGTVVVIRYDARTHRETDFGIGNFTGPDRSITA
jgi:hypothetical protein